VNILKKDSEQQEAEDGVRANIAQIAEAINEQNLNKYGSLVTTDFVNMNKDLQGGLTTTFSRQERLDVLKVYFENNPFITNAKMEATEVFADGDRAFAHIDGILKLTPKKGSELSGFTLFIDLYLCFHKADELGWLSERSMGIEKSRSDD
jgi:ketosteroid isomerase-like protein